LRLNDSLINELIERVPPLNQFIVGKLIAFWMTRIIGADFLVAIEAQWDCILVFVRSSIRLRNNVCCFYACASLFETKTANSGAPYEDSCFDGGWKGHKEQFTTLDGSDDS
jgi:hypothetical protein